MSCIEIIEVRSHTTSLVPLMEALESIAREMAASPNEDAMRMYVRYGMESDVSVHLLHADAPGDARGSRMGMRIIQVLKDWGLVNHSVWIEREAALPSSRNSEGVRS